MSFNVGNSGLDWKLVQHTLRKILESNSVENVKFALPKIIHAPSPPHAKALLTALLIVLRTSHPQLNR